MDISISTPELRSALHRVQGIIEAKNSMPILACVHLEAEVTPAGGRLTVKATDLEISAISSHPCEVKKPGTLAIQAKALHDVAKALPESVARLKAGANNRLEVTSGGSSFRLAGLPAEDYPAIATSEGLEYWPVDRQALRSGLECVTHAMSNDASRYNLNGVYFDLNNDGLDLVATDGHRLSTTRLNGFPCPKTVGFIVGRKAATELKKLLAEETSAPGEIAFNANSISYKRQGMTFVARLVDGSFPDYTQVVPKYEDEGAVLARSSMIDLLKRVLLLASDKSSAVNMDIKEGALTVSTRNPDMGEATETLAVQYTGKDFSIALNGQYLLDAIFANDCAALHLQFADDMSPVVLKPNDGSMLSVLMPMRR